MAVAGWWAFSTTVAEIQGKVYVSHASTASGGNLSTLKLQSFLSKELNWSPDL
jgi:hypothetical protein